MDRDAAVSRIKRRLKFRTDTGADTHIINALQDAQRELEGGGVPIPGGTVLTPFPWFLQNLDQVLAVLTGVPTVALPTGFISEIDGHAPHYTPTDTTRPVYLDKLRAETALRTFTEDAAPKAYEVRYNTIRIFPTPDADYTLYWGYRAGDTTLETNIENRWLAIVPELMMGLAGRMLAQDMEQEPTGFSEWITIGAAMLWRQNQEREIGANRRLAIGRLK